MPSAEHDTPTPALVAGHARATVLTGDGEFLALAPASMLRLLPTLPPPLVVHLPATARRLGVAGFPALDLLELFAFVRPATSVAPTPRGLALALGLALPADAEGEASLLPLAADLLLDQLVRIRNTPSGAEALALATLLAEAGWSWSRSVLAALRGAPPPARGGDALAVWRRLPVWEETAPRPAPSSHAVAPDASRQRLAALLGATAEARPGQSDYAHAAASAFAPRARRGDPILMLAEAGTGTGKTLGYLAPASLWAERNGGAVWISTYTRHLQRQIEREIVARFEASSAHAGRDLRHDPGGDPGRNPPGDPTRNSQGGAGRSSPAGAERRSPGGAERRSPGGAERRRVVVRKGRENYLCLLNYEDAVRAARGRGGGAAIVPLVLVARWALATNDGDLVSGDFPGWFRDLFGAATVSSLADRRGECIHGACPHYGACYVEHSIRHARDADLVIANHALVMTQAAHARGGDGAEDGVPTRYVFDEGHHIPDAADSAFSVELSGIEAAELRRWLLGAEGARSRARGLRRRLDDLVAGEAALETPLEAALLAAAQALVAPGWSRRIAGETDLAVMASGATPHPMEALLALLRRQVLARGQLETDLHPAAAGVAEAAATLARALDRVRAPLATLAERLLARLDDEADTLDATTRGRIEAMAGVIRRRALARITAWIDVLAAATAGPAGATAGPGGATAATTGPTARTTDPTTETTSPLAEPARATPEPGVCSEHVHVLRLHARDGNAAPDDVALCRHWLDPTLPFALTLAANAHGILVTSATLRDTSGAAFTPGDDEAERAWTAAEARVGAPHLPSPALRAALPSPFDYGRQTRCFVVTDVDGRDAEALAAAFRTLFLAAGGGGLGLFTAIARLRAVHARIKGPLEERGIPLFAQHVDAMDNASLVDVFRAERDSCLLGTDAMRDGVDVPGAALRLVVFERVPWMRPDILHRERRLHLSGGEPAAYDDRIVRLRLRQAFGRLIRSETDQGVFVLLDRRMPSRLLGAFPDGVVPERIGLAAAAARTGAFLSIG